VTDADLVELLVIARIDTTTAVADLFSCQTYYDADTGTETGPGVEAMWETLTVDPAAPICLDSLDQALTTSGYRRTSAWRKRVTAAGAIRYFAHATIAIPDLAQTRRRESAPQREPGGLTGVNGWLTTIRPSNSTGFPWAGSVGVPPTRAGMKGTPVMCLTAEAAGRDRSGVFCAQYNLSDRDDSSRPMVSCGSAAILVCWPVRPLRAGRRLGCGGRAAI